MQSKVLELAIYRKYSIKSEFLPGKKRRIRPRNVNFVLEGKKVQFSNFVLLSEHETNPSEIIIFWFKNACQCNLRITKTNKNRKRINCKLTDYNTKYCSKCDSTA